MGRAGPGWRFRRCPVLGLTKVGLGAEARDGQGPSHVCEGPEPSDWLIRELSCLLLHCPDVQNGHRTGPGCGQNQELHPGLLHLMLLLDSITWPNACCLLGSASAGSWSGTGTWFPQRQEKTHFCSASSLEEGMLIQISLQVNVEH